MAACKAVFGTHELIEAILVELPPFELVTATEVCTRWREVVRQSKRMPSMQRTLPSDFRLLPFGPLPIYANGTTFTLNPALSAEGHAISSSSSSSSSSSVDQVQPANQRRCDFFPRRPKLHEATANQSITLPPVTDLRCWYRDRTGPLLVRKRVQLHAKDGLTLKHVDYAMRRAELGGGHAFEASVVGTFRLG